MTSTEMVELTSEQARQLTDRIKVAVEGTWQLIQDAYTSRAWAALGYKSWDDYCTREFGTSRLRLPREDRQEVVASLRESGMSTRAIGAAIGVDQKTVVNDIRATEEYSSVEVEQFPSARRAVSFDDDQPEPETPIVGVNGKTYQRPDPKSAMAAARQRPITDAFFDAIYDLNKAVDRIERLAGDPRMTRNLEQVARHRNDLLKATNVLADVADRLS